MCCGSILVLEQASGSLMPISLKVKTCCKPMSRYMTLRDDVIFFIFLYQQGPWNRIMCFAWPPVTAARRRHIYKVDPNRPDEFGNVSVCDSEKETERVARRVA